MISVTSIGDRLELPLSSLIDWGKTLIVAPHPDDETLGCGGAIALLSPANSVQVLVISDGTASHPNSQKYPKNRLRSLREQETISALEILGLPSTNLTFLRLNDGHIPNIETREFNLALSQCRAYLEIHNPDTIILPWRRDPHADHRASWCLMDTAIKQSKLPRPRLLEYPIWSWDDTQTDKDTNPMPKKLKTWQLDITTVVEKKKIAIAQYRSQTTSLIDDDPDGFCLTAELLQKFTRPWEIYLETTFN